MPPRAGNEQIEFTPIGVIHTPYKALDRIPVQPRYGADITGTVELLDKFRPGLKDLDGFSHIILLYPFHKSRLDSIEGGVPHIRDLDIKPYIPDFDERSTVRTGWLEAIPEEIPVRKGRLRIDIAEAGSSK